MNRPDANRPTAWLVIVAFLNRYESRRIATAVARAADGGISAAADFLLCLFAGPIGIAVT